MKPKKLPPLRIGKHGQLMEWLEDYDEAIPNHRHTTHLIALFPSEQSTPRATPDLAKAARVTLERRIGRKDWEDVEWSRGNLISFFARLSDGDAAQSSIKRNACSPSRLFPPEAQWEKGHHRLDRRRIARVAVSPEEIGLCGCWQVIAVKRESIDLSQPDAEPTVEVGYYASSLSLAQRDEAAVAAAIRGHWSAIENGTHHRRDVTLGEDACRTAHRQGAAVLVSLRNLANGIYELQKEQKRTTVDSLRSWCQQQTFTTVWPILKR